MKAKIERNNSNYKININDELISPVAFRSFWPQENTVRNFSQKGFKIFGLFPTGINSALKVPYSQFGEIWTGNKEYNWENLRKQIDLFCRNAPDSYFSLMVQLDTRDWFLKEHPDCHDSFTHLAQVAAYTPWREAAAEFLCDLIDYIDENYPNKVWSVYLFAGNTCEWYSTGDHGEYSPQKEKLYKEWYKDETKTIPIYEELHHTENGIFRHPEKDKNAIDYWHFHNKIIAETISYFAGIVKEHTENKKLVGVFYGYLIQHDSYNSIQNGHNELNYILNDKNIDIVFSPASYRFRTLESTSAFLLPVDSLNLHKKAYFHEIDNTTHLSNDNKYAQILQTFGHNRLKSYDQTVSYIKREVALALSKGAGYWWFDMFAGWFDDVELMNEISKIKKVTERIYQKDMKSVSEVVVIVDQESLYYSSFNSKIVDNVVCYQIEELGKMGMPYDCYVSDDMIDQDFSSKQYELYIFLNLFKPSKNIIEKIKQLKKKGKSMVFVYAAGFITENGFSSAAMSGLIGIDIEEMKSMTVTDSEMMIDSNEYNKSHNSMLIRHFQPVKPMFECVDGQAEILGRYKNSKKPSFVLKEREKGFDVWSGIGCIPGSVLKEFARKAGCFIYSETDEPVYINKNMIGFYSHLGGKRILKVPHKGSLYDVYNDVSYKIINGIVELNFESDEMKLFEVMSS